MKELIRLEKVSKEYKQGDTVIHALDEVDLVIQRGKFMSVMGPSGCGKSTLMHTLGFLARPTAGRYLFDGRDSSKFTDDELANMRNKGIGFIFQAFNLLPRTSVLDNVLLPTTYSTGSDKEKVRERALELLEMVKLTHRLSNHPNQLSGGEQQRVAIARALINEPSLILADEPTGNLDSHSTKEIMDILTKLHEQGNTLLMVTHEEYLSKFTEWTIRMKDGKILP